MTDKNTMAAKHAALIDKVRRMIADVNEAIADDLAKRDAEEMLKAKLAGDCGCEECVEQEQSTVKVITIGSFALAGRELHFTNQIESGESRLVLTEFENGEKVDEATAGDDVGEGLNNFASEIMNMLMEEKASQTIAEMELDSESDESRIVVSAVNDVMGQIFTGSIRGVRKAG